MNRPERPPSAGEAQAIPAENNLLANRIPASILLAIGFLVLVVLVVITASEIAPYHYATQDLRARLRPPVFLGGTWAHPLGTDNLGRDVLSRLLYGIQTSLGIAFAGTIIGAAFGTALGFLAAHVKGIVDDILMMFVDVQASVPYIIVALSVLAFFGNDIVLFVILLGLEGWERYARLARGLVLAELSKPYVLALRGFGARAWRLHLRHVLPNIAAALVVQATIYFPWVILLETSISFLGLGIQPPRTSLGLMLGQGRAYLANAWWIAVFPGLAIFLTTLCVSLVGDWLRDRLDPTTQGT
jgi:peptide/nickel transport system permease protein